jgi:hypothetical protein
VWTRITSLFQEHPMSDCNPFGAFALGQLTGRQPGVTNITKSKVSTDDSR